MATAKTLEPGEFLHEQLAQASPDLMRELLASNGLVESSAPTATANRNRGR